MNSDRTTPPPTGKHGGAYAEEVLAEQVRQIYALAPAGMAATLINATIVFFILHGEIPVRLRLAWLAAIFAVTLLRIGLLLRFRRDFQPSAAARWGRRFVAGLVLIGIVWGSLGAISFTNPSFTLKVFLAFVLGGMAAGAATTFSPLRGAYLAFSIPALLPLVIHFFLQGDILHYAMGGMLILFGLLLWRLSRHNYRLTRTSLQLRFENRGIIVRLQQAKENTEGLYRNLLSQIEAKQQAEAELKAHQEHLERKVAERTTDLLRVNEQLRVEIEEKRQTEQALKEFQEKLTAAKEAAETANRAKSEFLANMSHEIRTPLAGAMGMIGLVLEMPIGEEEKRLLEMARRSTDSLLHLISDLLDFSRLEAGTMRFERKYFPISRAIETAMEAVSITAREKALQFFRHLDAAVPEVLLGDEGRLRQVLVNLLGNAVKFTERGEVALTVRPFRDPEAPGRGFLVFAVRDTGIGIPGDQVEKIFEKFMQVDSSLTRKYGGSGLGLALSRQIVEKMGGRIWAESQIGEGSTFCFTLPLEE